jgi:hypothetical protein
MKPAGTCWSLNGSTVSASLQFATKASGKVNRIPCAGSGRIPANGGEALERLLPAAFQHRIFRAFRISTERDTLGTGSDSHCARRPSRGIAASCGLGRHLKRDRRSISLRPRPIEQSTRQFLPDVTAEIASGWGAPGASNLHRNTFRFGPRPAHRRRDEAAVFKARYSQYAWRLLFIQFVS